MMVTEIVDSKGLFLWTSAEGNQGQPPELAKELAKLGPGDWADILRADLREVKGSADALKCETGTYGLRELIVLHPTRSQNVDADRMRLDVLAAAFVDPPDHAIQIRGRTANKGYITGGPPPKELLELSYYWEVWSDVRPANAGFEHAKPTVEIEADYWMKVDHAFEARAGQDNEWTIPLPDELIKAVREALKIEAK
jgi:hypothetical protein